MWNKLSLRKVFQLETTVKSCHLKKSTTNALASIDNSMVYTSSSVYYGAPTAGFIKLPSERTLRDYTKYFKPKSGYQVEVIKQLQNE